MSRASKILCVLGNETQLDGLLIPTLRQMSENFAASIGEVFDEEETVEVSQYFRRGGKPITVTISLKEEDSAETFRALRKLMGYDDMPVQPSQLFWDEADMRTDLAMRHAADADPYHPQRQSKGDKHRRKKFKRVRNDW